MRLDSVYDTIMSYVRDYRFSAYFKEEAADSKDSVVLLYRDYTDFEIEIMVRCVLNDKSSRPFSQQLEIINISMSVCKRIEAEKRNAETN